MIMEERCHKSFMEAVAVTREYNLRHYFLGNNNEFLIVEDAGEIRMYKDITKK